MLVLSRECDEQIVMRCPDGTEIRVEVCDIRSNSKVRLGIHAPDGVEIHRKEIWDRIRQADGAK